MELQQLWIYPIKSGRGISLTQATVKPEGLEYDRGWMIVNQEGKFLTQRQYPQLARLKVTITGDHLQLAIDGHNPLAIPLIYQQDNPEALILVQVWRDWVSAIDQGELAGQWLQQGLKLPELVKLVRLSPDHPRAIDPDYATATAQAVSFADGYPCLITNTASLQDLNDRLSDDETPITMDRFRPNLVIATDQPFIEDQWAELQIGEIRFDLVKPCSRCVVTTTDQRTGEKIGIKNP